MEAWRWIVGAAKCAAAWAGMDRTSDAESIGRVGVCRVCPDATCRRVRGAIAVFCGPALVEQRSSGDAGGGDGGPTCGCLVGYVPREAVRLVDEARDADRRTRALELALPACKSCVKSAKCPQEKWPQGD